MTSLHEPIAATRASPAIPPPNPPPPATKGREGTIATREASSTYYDQPALKASLYGLKVSGYMAVAGLAGSAQIIATAADLTDPAGSRSTVRHGRYAALAGTVVGASLLIIDLQTPQRFYNMLRIFRPTSPMSIGTYILMGFGALSATLAGGEWLRRRGVMPDRIDRAGKFAAVPAAILGMGMSTYTGALLGATSTPLWAAAPRLIPAAFGASAMSGAAAFLSLSLGGDGKSEKTLHRIEMVASVAELGLLAALPARLKEQGIETGSGAVPAMIASGLPLVAGLAARIAGPRLHRAAAIGTVAAAFLLRHMILRNGNRSAERPRDYFRFARPR